MPNIKKYLTVILCISSISISSCNGGVTTRTRNGNLYIEISNISEYSESKSSDCEYTNETENQESGQEVENKESGQEVETSQESGSFDFFSEVETTQESGQEVETSQENQEIEINQQGYQGIGSFYYGTNGICNGLSYSENQGYSFCESDTTGLNQLTLGQRNNLNIVAIGGLTRENRAELCGKNVRVYYNGISQGQDYVIWDKCASCGDTTLDFSIDSLQQINPNACQDGLTKNLSWEILDTNGIEFVS